MTGVSSWTASSLRPRASVAACALLLAAGAALAAPVTFRVNMGIFHSFGQFDPGADIVVLRGSMNGWSGNDDVLVDPDGDLVSEVVNDLGVGTHSYKFVLVRGGSDRWEQSIPDRVVSVASEPVSLEPVFFDHVAGWLPGGTRVGADISFTPQLVALGAEYRVDGAPIDLLDACADAGYEMVRLRLWHTPAEPWHGLDATLAFAHEMKARGLDLLLDLHYSDTWADPGHQVKPAVWEGLPFGALVDSVYAYTNAVIRRFRDEGVTPEYVQVGNEISAGMLWDDGRVGWQGSEWDTDTQWDKLAALVSAGVAGVRDSLPVGGQPKVVLHRAEGGDNAGCLWFFDNLVERGVTFDAIGLSYYPWWHGEIWALRDNLADLATRYGRELMVVELGYPWTLDWYDETANFVGDESQLHPGYPATPDGQFAFLRDVVTIVEGTPGGLGTAVLYWEPGFLSVAGGPGNPYENVTLFDFDGDALRGFGFAVPWSAGVDEGGSDASAFLSLGHPNPFGDTTTFAIDVPAPGGQVRLAVYDVAGRLVATLLDRSMRPGLCSASWDGRDTAGVRVAAGVYLLDAEIGGRRVARKTVRVR